MIKLSNSDGRFVALLLEQRRAALLEMTRPSDHLPREQVGELRRLDTVLTEIKAELPQITDSEIVEAVTLVRSL